VDLYYQKDGTPVDVDWSNPRASEILKELFAKEYRIIESDFVDLPTKGQVHVSTVFLVVDHSFGGGVPILFETMVFGYSKDDDDDYYQWRYHTEEAARRGHRIILEAVRAEALRGDSLEYVT